MKNIVIKKRTIFVYVNENCHISIEYVQTVIQMSVCWMQFVAEDHVSECNYI